MLSRLAFDILTHEDFVTVLPVQNIIFAYRPDGRSLTHRVPQYGSIGSDDTLGDTLWLEFAGLSENTRYIRARRIDHPTDIVIAFFVPDSGDAWADWGYIWNLDDPRESSWQRMNTVVFVEESARVKRIRVANGIGLASRIPLLGFDPDEIAAAEEQPDHMVARIQPLIDWLTGYQRALCKEACRRQATKQ